MPRTLSLIVITGASSGLGQALAIAYAAPGRTLHLLGRDAQRLEITANDVRKRHATAICHTVDVTDSHHMADLLTAIDVATPIDLLIANAGISAGTGGGEEAPDQARAIFATNINGVLNTITPILPAMRARKAGQVAIMSSMASFRGFPGAPAYCASKAAVRTWGESLRGEAAADGVRVNVICPGFVKTPMTDINPFPMPFMVSAHQAASTVRRALARNVGRIIFPWPMVFVSWALRALPDAWLNRMAQRLPRKP